MFNDCSTIDFHPKVVKNVGSLGHRSRMTIASYEASAKKKNYNQEKSRNSILKSKKIGAKHHGMAYNYRSENSLRKWTFFCFALFLLVSQFFFLFHNYIFSRAVGRYENLEGGGKAVIQGILNLRRVCFYSCQNLGEGTLHSRIRWL